MVSRATTCLRIASRQLGLTTKAPSRSLGTVSKARQYPSTTASRSATATSTAPKPTTTTTTTTRSTPSTSSTTNGSSSTTTTNSTASKTASPASPPAAARKPVPAVSGVPLPDAPSATDPNSGSDKPIDWSSSYHGLGTSTFGPEVATVLQAPLDADDIEVKPDGIIYLPEIKYRRVLNNAFGPGGWGLAPRGDLVVQDRLVSRDYALIVHGRFVGQARGEQQYFNEDGISTAAEGCKSNALMRCCKDLGIASELWDPRFIRKFMRSHAQQVWVEHVVTKKKKQIWLRKDDEVRYPFKKSAGSGSASSI
ncbi:hypothetical protein PG993_005386 [Apiospora rasikravindrae]|uniref:Mitochondrial genome maintenance protein MGM101 n=1 Tax=Apiospora rasikravindrae TaxID=990691 RepID=A0ABR1TFG7_9PEZI